jgi:ferric-dicitrate binding protein FerR (iron transport regulator)
MPEMMDEDSLAQLLRAAGPRVEVPTPVHAAAHAAALEAWQQAVARRRRRRRYLGFSLAAAATMLVAIGALLWRTTHFEMGAAPIGVMVQSFGTVEVDQRQVRGRAPAGNLVSGAVIETATGSGARVWLHQGQELRIDAHTRLKLRKGGRVLLQRGRIYAAAGDSQRNPLRVRTEWGEVSDIGTRFEVSVDEQGLNVRVRDGRVSVTPTRGTATELGAGAAARVSPDGVLHRRSIATYGPEWGWMLGLGASFDIDGRSLAEFLSWIAAEMGWKLEYVGARSEQLAREHVLHGSTTDLTPEESLRVVMKSSGVAYRLQDGVLRVGGTE